MTCGVVKTGNATAPCPAMVITCADIVRLVIVLTQKVQEIRNGDQSLLLRPLISTVDPNLVIIYNYIHDHAVTSLDN